MPIFVRFAALLLLAGMIIGLTNALFYGESFLPPVLVAMVITWALWHTCGDLPE